MAFVSLIMNLKKSFHFRTKSVMIDPSYSISSKLKITSWLKIKIIWMNCPICQLTIFTIRHWIHLKASIWGMTMCGMHSLSLFSWLILGQNCHINCHDLQTTGSKCLKLGIPALQCINRKPIKNEEYFTNWIQFCKHLSDVS